MSPADIIVQWPTAHEIALAVFTAAKLEGEDPIEVLQGKPGAHARLYAGFALAHQYPTAPRSTLGRKLGNSSCLGSFRTGLRSGAIKWFDLGRLNSVRAACGWAAMTHDEALTAPLLYCGRSWEEFVDRIGENAQSCAESPTLTAAAGPTNDEAPASIRPAEDAPPAPPAAEVVRSDHTGDDLVSSSRRSADAGPAREQAPAQFQPDAVAKATNGKASEAHQAQPGTELRVGGAEAAHPSPGAGAGFDPSRADGTDPVDGLADPVDGLAGSVGVFAETVDAAASGAQSADLSAEIPGDAEKTGALAVAPKYLSRLEEKLAVRPRFAAPEPVEAEDNDLPAASPPRPPSAAAVALAAAARSMRAPSARARVIDRRPQYGDVTAEFCGDPGPGRSALAQRGGQ